MIFGLANQVIGAELIDAGSGGAFGGVVTCYVTVDGGVQAIGSVGSGICTAEGQGYFTYRPSVPEVTGSLLAFTFVGTGAVPATIQVATITAAQAAAVVGASGSHTTTVSALITAAFQRLNLIAAGESLEAEDLAIGFSRLNDFVDACAIERLLIYTITRTTWTISATQTYTVGTGATINIARPALSTELTVRFQDTSVTPTLEMSLGALITEDAWQLIPQKSLTAPYPVAAYYNPTFTSGFGTINLWPIPTSSTLQGVLYAPQQVGEFATTADVVSLPPGYRRFLRDNLAIEIATDYPGAAVVTQELKDSARDSKAAIKRANIRLVDLPVDAAALFGGGPHYSILTGP